MANENRFYKTPFASSGDKAEVPNESVNGAVSYDTGFGPDYELPQGQVNRKRIERDMYNGVLNGVTKNLKQWQESLYPTWIEDNGDGVAFAYAADMIVSHNSNNWISNQAANQEEPGTGTQWSIHIERRSKIYFNTLASMTGSTIDFPLNTQLHVVDINTDYTVTTGASPRAESPAITGGKHALFNIPAFVSNDQISGAQDTKGLSVVGCAVRITSGGEGVDNTFAIIDDSQHDPINCTSVTGGLNTINVLHEQPFSDVVGVTVVVPDETLTQRGIMCGGSIAADQSITTLTKRHQFKIDWQAGALDIANLIIDPFMDSTRYVPTDNTGGNGAYSVVMPRTLDGNRVITPIDRTSPDAFIKTVSDTTADIFPYKTVTINCAYNGSIWAVTSPQSSITAALSSIGVTCASAGNLITVTHPQTLGLNSNALATAGVASDYFAVNVFGETTTTTTIALVDDTGEPQAPVNGDAFNIRLEDILWEYGQSAVDIGIVRVSPTLDFKDIGAANNFWLLGNHWALK